MNKNILITIKKELRGILRDKKSLLMMLVTPLMVPAFIFLFSFIYDDLMAEETAIDKEPTVIGFNYILSDAELNIAKEINVEGKTYESIEKLEEGYNNHEYDAYIVKEDNNYVIYANVNETNGMTSSALAQQFLESYNIYLGKNKLEQIGIDFNEIFSNVNVEVNELGGHSSLVDVILSMGMVFTVMSISLSAIYGVTDTTAGEKERGTLETFLTFPIKSSELIIGKYFAITISSLVTAIISLTLLVISILISSNIFAIYRDAIININALSILISVLIMFSYAFFISGLCIAIASFSKTYKEAQSSLTPVSFLTMIPMFMNIMEVKLNYGIAFLPVVSHTMLIDYMLTSNINEFNFLYLLISIVSTTIYSIIIVKIITKMYRSEKVLFQN